MTSTNQTVQYVPPSALLGDNNSRFGLRPSGVAEMAAAILRDGEILQPLEVTPLEKPVDGATYRILDGHYRHAAATELAKEHEGVVCPIIVKTEQLSDLERLKRQTSFNFNRQDLSPIDIGMAAKAMLDGGMSRQEVRSVFGSSTSGGRGGKKQEFKPASNSYINMMISFLDFPKDIKAKIHEGVIGVAGAYKLSTKPKEKWAEIVAEAEADRDAEIKAEASREEKYLESVKKDEERLKKEQDLKTAAEAAATKLKETSAALDVAAKAEADAVQALRKGAADDAEKAKLAEAAKTAKEAAEKLVKEAETAKKDVEKANNKLATLATQAAERAKKLEAARKDAAKKAPAKPIGGGAIDKAAAKKGAGNFVALNATQMRTAVDEWALPGSVKVQAIAAVIKRCFSGELTNQQAYTEMLKVTGESKSKAKASDK